MKKVSLILGMFDGVHKGHQALIQKAKEFAAVNEVAVFTFSNAPSAYFGRSVPLLTLPCEKEKLLREYGVDQVEMQTFDVHLAELTPQEYIDLLNKKFQIENIIIGYNHVFGKGAAGNGALLLKKGRQYGYKTYIIEPILQNQAPISSTRIRNCLALGRMEEANEMLGYRYFLKGKVIGGRRIGNTLGFPTANIAADQQKLLPKEGVYITMTELDGQFYRSITNIGTNPTVSQSIKRSVETHILRFGRDIYDESICVHFIKRLRDEQTFESKDALSQQLEQDKQYADAYLNQYYFKNGQTLF